MKTVLVCEDEVAIRDFVVINLTYAGFRVIEAGSAEEALERFDSSVDMALLDIMLPGMDGLTLCRTLREKSEDMGIIMLSARTQEQEKIDALRMGADDYVTKPFSPSELIARIEALYRRVAAAREQKQPVEEICSGSFVLNADGDQERSVAGSDAGRIPNAVFLFPKSRPSARPYGNFAARVGRCVHRCREDR